AAAEINERKSTHKLVAHVDDICLGEVDDAVAIGVTRAVVDEFDFFAIKMDGGRLVERDDGIGIFCQLEVAREADAHVALGNNHRTLAAKSRIATRVVTVMVS